MRIKISKFMGITAVLGVNIGWIRAFLLAEISGMEFHDEFDSIFLIFFALQFGLWRYLRATEKRRRFWLGFVVSGFLAAAALVFLPGFGNQLGNLMAWYTDAASDLAYFILPRRLDAELSTGHWDCFLAIIYFLPELLAAILGGLLAACFFRRTGEVRSTSAS